MAEALTSAPARQQRFQSGANDTRQNWPTLGAGGTMERSSSDGGSAPPSLNSSEALSGSRQEGARMQTRNQQIGSSTHGPLAERPHGPASHSGSLSGISTADTGAETADSGEDIQFKPGIRAPLVSEEARNAVELLSPQLCTVLHAGVGCVVLTLGHLGAALCTLRSVSIHLRALA